jgi:hypothetical protein
VPTAGPVAGEPSLVTLDPCVAYLAYKSADGVVHTNRASALPT